MFHLFLFLIISSGIAIGGWFAIRHGEMYRLNLNYVSNNSSIASIPNSDSSFYDTENVDEYDPDTMSTDHEKEMIRESVVIEDEGISSKKKSLNIVESTEPEAALDWTNIVPPKYDEFADQNAISKKEPSTQTLENAEQSGVVIQEQDTKFGEITGIVSEPEGTVAQSSSEWLSAEKIEALVQMIDVSDTSLPEYQEVFTMLQEVKSILTSPVESLAPQDFMNAELAFPPESSGYLSRVICRPKIGCH